MVALSGNTPEESSLIVMARIALERKKRKLAEAHELIEKPVIAFGVCLCDEMDSNGSLLRCAKDCPERRVRKQWRRYCKHRQTAKEVEN